MAIGLTDLPNSLALAVFRDPAMGGLETGKGVLKIGVETGPQRAVRSGGPVVFMTGILYRR